MPLNPRQTDLLDKLTKDDWQYIQHSVANRIAAASPHKGEPPASREFKTQVSRIEAALFAVAFPRQGE